MALLVLPATAALGINLDSNPQQVAYLYGMGLIGTWAALTANKLFENRSIDMSSRRLIALVAGLIVGAVGILLGHALQLGLPLEHHYYNANSRILNRFTLGQCTAPVPGGGGWLPVTARSGSDLYPSA